MEAMSQQFVLPRAMRREGAIERIARVLGTLSQECAWRVSVEEHKPTRSSAQNNYLNGVCYKLIGDAIGYERDEISEFLAGTYWGWKEKKVPKKPSNPAGIESVPIRTTTIDENGKRSVLDKMAMVDYIAFVQRFAAGKGIWIPDPDEGEGTRERAA
jgi:hypothetical protein